MAEYFSLWLYSPILGLGRLHETFRFISVTRSRTFGRTPLTGDEPIARPLLTVPGDCDDGEVGGMNGFGRGNRSTRSKPPRRHFVHHKSHLPDPSTNLGRRSGKPVTNCFSYGAAYIAEYLSNNLYQIILIIIIIITIIWNILTYLRSWALLEEPPIVQPLKNFPAFYGTRRFNNVFTRDLHWSLSWTISIQSTPFHPISLRSILILSTHLHLKHTTARNKILSS
jgi:hypothetical protein